MMDSPKSETTLPGVPLATLVLAGGEARTHQTTVVDVDSGRTTSYRQLAAAVRRVRAALRRRVVAVVIATVSVFDLYSLQVVMNLALRAGSSVVPVAR